MANDKKNKIEVVKGKGKLDISPVKGHLDVEKPREKTSKDNIIIPTVKKNKNR